MLICEVSAVCYAHGKRRSVVYVPVRSIVHACEICTLAVGSFFFVCSWIRVHVGVHILPCVFLCVCPCAPARYRGKGTFVGAVSLQRLRNKEVVSLHLFLFSELRVRDQPSARGHTNSGIHFLYGCVRVSHAGIYT